MKKTGLLALFAFSLLYQIAQTKEILLWPQGLPEGSKPFPRAKAEELKKKNSAERICYVEKPCLVPFLVRGSKNTGAAVIVCPGGGYYILAWQKEGVEIARWLNSFGVNAFVLKYRVPRRDPEKPHFEPLQDAQRAIRLVRSRAKLWKLDPQRIGMLGFSAGGHLTIMAGLHHDQKTYEPVDSADKLSARPDFIIPIYPAYLGDNYRDDVAQLGSLVRDVKNCPPTFIAVAWDDRMRGAQAALFFAELRKADVPAEIHVFTKGGHGYGMRPSPHPVARLWPKLCSAWLKDLGFLSPKGKAPK